VADYLLDTNVISHWYDASPDGGESVKTAHRRVLENVSRVRAPDPETGYVPRFFISFITKGEMAYAARTSRGSDPKKMATYAERDADKLRFVQEQCPEELEWNKHVPEVYGELKAWVFERCGPKRLRSRKVRLKQLIDPVTATTLDISDNDLWIAAQAMTHALVLVTQDRRGNFGKLLVQFESSLSVENWAL
jgi:predicted nucleic acid-binding protein